MWFTAPASRARRCASCKSASARSRRPSGAPSPAWRRRARPSSSRAWSCSAPCSTALDSTRRSSPSATSSTAPHCWPPAPPSPPEEEAMTIDVAAAHDFMATHARVLDRRRFELQNGGTDASAALAALDGYRNPDGGYGWGLEADLRSPESQPGAAAHAFEVFEDIAPATALQAAGLCDWLDSITLEDGGLPFVLPLSTNAASAPWWHNGDASTSSLQITAFTCAVAQRVAAHDPGVAAHRWLERATPYCLDAIAALHETPFAYVLAFSVQFLDAVRDR